MVPSMLVLIDDIEEETVTSELTVQANGLREAIGKAYYNGTDSSMVMELSIPSGKALGIGGTGTDGYIIRLISGGDLVGNVFIDNPAVRVHGSEKMLSGHVSLYLTSMVIGSEQVVEVDVV